MEFELTPELIDQVIFGMENQGDDYLLNSRLGVVVPVGEIVGDDDSDTYVPLPEWRSIHGFQLMERFTATLRNPLMRESLRDALSAGKGVFRQFKNALKSRPDVERLWFRFKEREMRRLVFEWYNQFRDAWGLSRIGFEPEETEELILSDFAILPGPGDYGAELAELDREAFRELYENLPEGSSDILYRKVRAERSPDSPASGDILFVATAPETDSGGELAGFIWGCEDHSLPGYPVVEVLQLYVCGEYRGLGLGKALVHYFVRHVRDAGLPRIRMNLEGESKRFLASLERDGFAARRIEVELDLLQYTGDEIV